MSEYPSSSRSPTLPTLYSAEEATAQIEKIFDSAAEQIADFARDLAEPKTIVIKATTGIGKTRSLKNLLSTILPTLPDGKAVAIFEPTLAKADEFTVETRNALIDEGVIKAGEWVVLRGREAPIHDDFDSDRRMCERWETAAALAAAGEDVTRRLCRAKRYDADGNEDGFDVCPFAEICPHLRQTEKARTARVIVGTHAHLWVGHSELSDEKGRIAAIVLDENATGGLIKTGTTIRLADLFDIPPSPSAPWIGREPNPETASNDLDGIADEAERLTRIKARYLRITTALRPVIDAARAEGRNAVTVADLIAAVAEAEQIAPTDFDALHSAFSFLAVAERRKVELREIKPSTADTRTREIVAASRIFDRNARASLWTRIRDQIDLFATLDEEGRNDRTCRSVIIDENHIIKTESGPIVVPSLVLAYRKDFKGSVGKVPTIVLDADADRLIYDRFFKVEPENWHDISVRFRAATLRQVVDRTCSMTSLKTARTQREIIGAAHHLVEKHRARITDPSRRVAIFTTLAGEQGILATTSEDPITAGIEGRFDPSTMTTGHYAALRGKNGYSDCVAAIVAGRIEPNIDAIETLAKALWSDTADELQFVARAEDGTKRYTKVEDWIRTKGDRLHSVTRSGHPDARIDRLFLSVGRAEARQAIGRARLVHRREPCEIYVMTSIPLGCDIEIDTTHEWGDLAGSIFDQINVGGVIPTRADHQAALLGIATGTLRTAASRRRDRRELEAPARRTLETAYADILDRPDDLGIGDTRRVLLVRYATAHTMHEAIVFVRQGETRAAAFRRASTILARIEGVVSIEQGIDTDNLADFEAEFPSLAPWFLALPTARTGKGRATRSPPLYEPRAAL